MTPDDLRQQIELHIVELIKQKLADGSMTEERSQTLAEHVLETLKPGMNFEELYKNIPKIDDSYPELAPIVIPIVREYEEHITKQAQAGVLELIKQGQYDAAQKLAKKVIDQDVELVWQGSGKPDA